MEKFLTYTNLLMMYCNEHDKEKKDKIRFELMLLEQGFKPIFTEKQ